MRAWSKRHYRLLIVLLVLVDTIAIFSAATYKLFVDPQIDPVRRSDAVVVIAGGPFRLSKGIELVREGVAPLLIVSNPRGYWAYLWTAPDICNGAKRSFEVICFHPKPESTQGEARAVKRIAAARHLRSLIVVTSTFHVSRARLIMRRCFHGRLSVIGTPLADPWKKPFYVAMEWPKLIYAETLNRGC
ncbi:MAG: YdcF family protein [Gaiellaceae bacterium]